ncbi:MAG: GNAT family N-acetyltransferase [Nitrosomonadales bacterium]|nr:GNAT family N-acetyltransferase [Nitrosomonadales bacterium]
MTTELEYVLNKASAEQIAGHLSSCDADFMPALSSRVAISDYAEKLASKSMRFEAWSGGLLVGLVAAYCNDRERHIAFISTVSVLKAWTGKGIAANLLKQCMEYAKKTGMQQVSLEVAGDNMPAIALYRKNGFVVNGVKESFVCMSLYLPGAAGHG